jgi:hypothetical protein
MERRPFPRPGQRFALGVRHLPIGGIVENQHTGHERSRGGGAVDLMDSNAGAALDLCDESLVARLGKGKQIREAAQEQPRFRYRREERRGRRRQAVAQREHRRGGT